MALKPADSEVAGIAIGILADDPIAGALVTHAHDPGVGTDEVEVFEKAEQLGSVAAPTTPPPTRSSWQQMRDSRVSLAE